MNQRELEVVEAVRMETYPTLAEGIPTAFGPVTLTDWHCCVLASRLAIDVLKANYIGAKPMKVQALIFNEKAWRAELAGEQLWNLLPDGNVGIAGSDYAVFPCGFRDEGRQNDKTPEGLLNGHVIAIVENEALLDPSAVQFTHLEYGLLVEPVAAGLTNDVGREWLKDPGKDFLAVELPDGGAILYRQSPDLAGVFDASDWKDRGFEYQAMFQAISEAVYRRVS